MASFRSAEKQAAHAAKCINAIGSSRRDAKGQGKVSSVRTLNAYLAVYERFAEWMKDNWRNQGIHRANAHDALAYLHARASQLSQKALDGELAALRKLTRDEIPRVHSTHTPERDLANTSRYISRDDVARIAARQDERNALASLIAREAGLRAAELATLRRIEERAPTAARAWDARRWQGKEDWAAYSVKGKGGLCREVRLSPALARELEARRIGETQSTDRGVRLNSVYDIGAGNAWSKSFQAASVREFGFSLGAHSVRHGFARDEVARHVGSGANIRDAMTRTSQELGHWRPDIVRAYLR